MLSLPQGTDGTFVMKLRQRLAAHPRFVCNQRGGSNDSFELVHYAGPVNYSAAGFLLKNKDPLSTGEGGGGVCGEDASCVTGHATPQGCEWPLCLKWLRARLGPQP